MTLWRAWFYREDAGISMMTALMMMMLIGATGLAIDGSRAYLARFKFQAALDAAALATGSTFGTDEELQQVALEFVDRNFGIEGARVLSVSVNSNADLVTVSGRFELDTFFMQIFQQDEIQMSAATEVKRAGGGLMVSLVLDNTGSMWSGAGSGQSRIEALRGASQTLVDALFGDATDTDDLRVAVVPYAAAVNPGLAGVVSDPMASPYFDPSDETAWRGCVMERAGNASLADTDMSTGGYWTRYVYPPGDDNDYTPGDADSIVPGGIVNSNQITGPNIGCPTPVLPLTRYKSEIDAAIDAMSAWNRGGTLTDIGIAWGLRSLSPQAPFTESGDEVDPETNATLWNSQRWRRAMVIMTDGESGFYNFPGGGDANQEGTSPNDAHPSASDHTTYGRWDATGSNAKAIFDAAPGMTYPNGTTDTSMRGKLNRRIHDLCETAKGQGIVVYTVVFTSSVGQSTRDVFRACASDPGKYWYAPDTDALNDAFDQVGSDLSKLRITR